MRAVDSIVKYIEGQGMTQEERPQWSDVAVRLCGIS